MAASKKELDSTKKTLNSLKLSVSINNAEQTGAVFHKHVSVEKLDNAINNNLFKDGATVPWRVVFSESQSDSSDDEVEEAVEKALNSLSIQG